MISTFSPTYVELLLVSIAGLQFLLSLIIIINQQLLPSKLLPFINGLLLLIGIYVTFMYTLEVFVGWYTGYLYEQVAFYNRALGGYGVTLSLFAFLGMVGAPQLFWFQKIRTSASRTIFVCGVIILSFYLLHNHVLLMTSNYRDYLPSGWSY